MGLTFNGMILNLSGITIVSRPDAPTIGTATATIATTATVDFIAPAYNGGATITNYTAVSSPGGITGTLSQSDSGTITVSGLTPDTSYTFTVYATNSEGNSSSSSASNEITTLPNVGQAIFVTSGTYSWTVPDAITSISVVCVGGGGGSGGSTATSGGQGGQGGQLAYLNNYTVTPGATISVTVGAGGAGQPAGTTTRTLGGNSSISVSGTLVFGAKGAGQGSGALGTPTIQYQGGSGGSPKTTSPYSGGGGAGAGGYAGAGGSGGSSGGVGAGGSGGGGGGGAPKQSASTGSKAGGGGGVGLYGEGYSGSGGNSSLLAEGGTAGSADFADVPPLEYAPTNGNSGYGGGDGLGSKGGWPGGGGGGAAYVSSNQPGIAGGMGGVRIIWPGNARQFPSTRTLDE